MNRWVLIAGAAFLLTSPLVLLLGSWGADVALRSGTVHPIRVAWLYTGALLPAAFGLLIGCALVVASLAALGDEWLQRRRRP